MKHPVRARVRLIYACCFLAGSALVLAAWDPAKPAYRSPAISAEIRANWVAIAETVGSENVIADNTFLVWAAGDSAAPSYYTVAGSGAAVARTGTGLADTSRKVGPFAAKLTSASATATLSQDMLPSTAYDDSFDGLPLACGAFVSSPSASAARIALADGAGTSYSAYHSGSGTWQWLTVRRTVDASATKITWLLQVETGSNAAIVSAPTCLVGSIPPTYPRLSRWQRGDAYRMNVVGVISIGLTMGRWSWPWRAGLIDDVQLYAGTAPLVQPLIVDVNTWDGSAFTSMFTSGGRPRIAAGAFRGNAAPDGTYARRAFQGLHATAVPTGGEMSVDIDQVGIGVTGADLVVSIRPRFPVRPLEALLAPTQ